MKFSIVIPTYNRRHTIAAAIDSALAQQDVHPGSLEVLVVDDHSTDDTVQWLQSTYQTQAVRVLTNTRSKGPAGGRNTGLLASEADMVAFLDSDDAFLPNHLADASRAFDAHPGVDVLFGRARYERQGEPVDYMGPNFERKLALAGTTHRDDAVCVFDSNFFTHLLKQGCWFNLSSVVMRHGARQALMEESLRVAEDFEFWARLARQHGFGCLLAPQIRYSLGDDNISFEADAAVEGHSPQLLRAFEIMRGYQGLSTEQDAILKDQIAGLLFDWGYRCRLRGRRAEAWKLHWRSLRMGRRTSNLAALAKVLLAAPARNASTQP